MFQTTNWHLRRADGILMPSLRKYSSLTAIAMEHLDKMDKRFLEVNFTLSREDILKLDQEDNGPIHNVISGVNRHCFGAKLFDDELGLAVEMFYINNDTQLKGDIICLNLDDPDYFHLLLSFCNMLAINYEGIDAISAFNILQTKLRSFLEKRGFLTTTTLELEKLPKGHITLVGITPRGIKNVTLINRVKFYRNFFNNNYLISQVDGKE